MAPVIRTRILIGRLTAHFRYRLISTLQYIKKRASVCPTMQPFICIWFNVLNFVRVKKAPFWIKKMRRLLEITWWIYEILKKIIAPEYIVRSHCGFSTHQSACESEKYPIKYVSICFVLWCRILTDNFPAMVVVLIVALSPTRSCREYLGVYFAEVYVDHMCSATNMRNTKQVQITPDHSGCNRGHQKERR